MAAGARETPKKLAFSGRNLTPRRSAPIRPRFLKTDVILTQALAGGERKAGMKEDF
jgi:hypothetical protein